MSEMALRGKKKNNKKKTVISSKPCHDSAFAAIKNNQICPYPLFFFHFNYVNVEDNATQSSINHLKPLKDVSV